MAPRSRKEFDEDHEAEGEKETKKLPVLLLVRRKERWTGFVHEQVPMNI